jgi:signal transduction histidine kinase
MTLFRKILLAMLLLSLLPLLVSSAILSVNLGNIREKLAIKISETADRQASETLRLRAEQVAENVATFLEECNADLLFFAALPRDPATLKLFYDSRKGEIWYRSFSGATAQEQRAWVPRYSSLALIDKNGREMYAITDGKRVAERELRNVSLPANTDYRSEQYFRLASALHKGEIYVSHLTGFHLTKGEQLGDSADPESAVTGKEYRGVIRFATPIFDSRGNFNGVAVLSLDHRHLMEFSQHIHPGGGASPVFPSYKSGNYAFIFDDEGWIITHPKFWDIRGVDSSGKLVPPYSPHSTTADIEAGRIPFNLDSAGFIHANYPVVSRLIREKKSGYVDITNVGGAKKIMAFAPIIFNTGDYRHHGVFGAVTIGFQVDQFHEMARTGVDLLNSQLHDHVQASFLIVAMTALCAGVFAWLLTRSITRPLALLTDGARQLANGATGNLVDIRSNDELGELAGNFNRMAADLEQRKNSLLQTLEELQSSRKEIMDERNFKESVLESISSAIMTFSPVGVMTSINKTGKRLLGEAAEPGKVYTEVFQDWHDMAQRISRVLARQKQYGREPLIMADGDKDRHYEVGFFPIGKGTDQGITVTMRDETEKERMREEMTRMDRLASLGKLSAGIAHEVRNPLTGISLMLDDLHDRTTLDQDSRELMGRALLEIERVEKLIAALLNYASPSRSDFREDDINRVVQETLLLLKRVCERQQVELRFLPGNLPLFRFDKEKIKQALLNLVKNALEALPQGGTIEVATADDGKWARISVIDNGQGISEADLPLIFEPFFTRKGAGTGLGLSITQRIIEEHNGRIAVKSPRKGGTIFTVTLPMATSGPAINPLPA